MDWLLGGLSNLWWNITNRFSIIDIIDVAIVTYLLFELLRLTKHTRANSVLKGLGIMLIASWLADTFKLQVMKWVLTYIIQSGAIVLVVLFQPELRRALEQIGRGGLFDRAIRSTPLNEEGIDVAEEITRGIINMSKRKVGVLILIEQKTGLSDILETGTRLDALISSGLLVNIFEPNTPLHDGATVIKGSRILAAGCFLQLTEDLDVSKELGTRHRAAIGITESSDCISLIVSEESGVISYARAGKLTRYLDAKSLKELLNEIYMKDREPSIIDSITSLKKRRRKNERK